MSAPKSGRWQIYAPWIDEQIGPHQSVTYSIAEAERLFGLPANKCNTRKYWKLVGRHAEFQNRGITITTAGTSKEFAESVTFSRRHSVVPEG